MIQDIISGTALILLSILIEIFRRRNKERRKNEEEQLKRLQSLNDYQLGHVEETKELNSTLKQMNKEIALSRVDSRCAIYALRKASNGIKFNEYIEEERERLMAEYSFQYRD